MKNIIILSGHNKFQEIWSENMALELIWNCRHDTCCQNLTAFLADISLLEGRMGTDLRETLTFLMGADCSTFCAFLDSFEPFLALFSPSESVMHLVPMERLRAIASSTWSLVLLLCLLLLVLLLLLLLFLLLLLLQALTQLLQGPVGQALVCLYTNLASSSPQGSKRITCLKLFTRNINMTVFTGITRL